MSKKENSTPLMGSVKYRDGLDLRKVLNESLNVFFKDAWRVALTSPSQTYHFLRTIKWQHKAASTRSTWKKQGIEVPPILILSITNRCNLKCKGCYNWALRPTSESEMDAKKLRSIIAEANELGISFIVIAGGEPLTRPEILDITQAFPEITFLVFTNGLLITDETSKRLAKQRNFVPVLSIEGREEETDERRGTGIYQRLQSTIENLQRQSIFWSVSLTITRDNYSTVTDEKFVKYLVDHGCKMFFFVEYTPVSKDTEYRVITNEQRKNLMAIRDSLRSRLSALFIAIPGDEEEIGGCLSAGRGFVHISATGDVEPCPFVPYSDTNIRVVSLKEALMSEFLKSIRENRIQFDKEKGGCTLWQQREWIKSLISDN